MVEVVGLPYARNRQVLERVDRFFQMPSRQVQVDAGGLQIGMTHQDLDRRQVGAVFKQVSGETVAQGLLILLMIPMQQRSAISFIRSTV